MVGRLMPLTSCRAEIGKSPFPTPFEKATSLLIYLPTTQIKSLLLCNVSNRTSVREVCKSYL
ncbi:hypothetical protein LINPERPRIM_LOCUS32351 [Linum perenne]